MLSQPSSKRQKSDKKSDTKSEKKSDKKSEKKSKNKHQKETIKQAVITYELSDNSFIDKGWTKLPSRGTDPRLKPWICFKKKNCGSAKYYGNGNVAVSINDDGSGKVFYRDGKLAIRLIDSLGIGQHILLYCSKASAKSITGEMDQDNPIGRIDSLGNCAIFNSEGDVLVTYDEQGGVLYISQSEFYRWEWSSWKSSPAQGGRKKLPQKRVQSLVNCFSDFKNVAKTCMPTVSAELLANSLLDRSYVHQLQSTNRGQEQWLHCKVNENIALWIYSRHKIQLSFACDGFKCRFDVGVDVREKSRGQSA